jgi:hypothetical protein
VVAQSLGETRAHECALVSGKRYSAMCVNKLAQAPELLVRDGQPAVGQQGSDSIRGVTAGYHGWFCATVDVVWGTTGVITVPRIYLETRVSLELRPVASS